MNAFLRKTSNSPFFLNVCKMDSIADRLFWVRGRSEVLSFLRASMGSTAGPSPACRLRISMVLWKEGEEVVEEDALE